MTDKNHFFGRDKPGAVPATGRGSLPRRRLLAGGIAALGTGIAGCVSVSFGSGETTTLLMPDAVRHDDGGFELSYVHDGERIAEFVVSRGQARGQNVRVVPFSCSLSYPAERLHAGNLRCTLQTQWTEGANAPPPELALSPHPDEDWPPVAFTTEEPGEATVEVSDPELSDGSAGFRILAVRPVPAPWELAVDLSAHLENGRKEEFRLNGFDVIELPSAGDTEPS